MLMASTWSPQELRMLSHISERATVDQMMQLIPNRSKGAIIQKAQEFDFGITTSKEDRVTRFYLGLKHRQGGARIAATNDVEVPVATEVPAVYAEPQRIIAYDGFSANALAVRMLDENNLDGNPEIIYQLSLHILKGMS